MNESILNTVKKMMGIPESDTSFDPDLIVNINTVCAILYQIGVGSVYFSIEDDSATWEDLLGNATNLELVKTYMFMKVRMMFDPPTGSVAESTNAILSELEWRISVTVDPITTFAGGQ